MTLEYDIKEAIKITKRFAPNFPLHVCTIAPKVMSHFGYKIVAGTVKLDNYCNIGKLKELPAYWNIDPRTNMHIDITARQYKEHTTIELDDVETWFEKHRIYRPQSIGISQERVPGILIKHIY